MRTKYHLLFTALLLGALLWPAQRAQAQAAGDTLWVEWQDQQTGEVIINALRDAIANDTERPANRVYGLYRSGLYYNEDRIENAGFHLNIAGQTAGVLEPGVEDFGPAVIQMVTREDGSVDQRMITGQDDITLRNIWITGQDDAGATTAYLPIQVDASDARFVFDHIIFERSNFALVGFTGENNDVFITNSVYRNFINTSQQWEGRGIQFTAGADTVVVENNTFFNIGMTVVQSEAQPINYIRFNHNTVVNLGRNLNSGGLWREAYFANNILVNTFWHGEGSADIDQPNREDFYSGIFGISDLPAEYGTNLGRQIVFANTATWRDPAFATYYADSIRAQPLFNETTAGYFADFENMLEKDNLIDVNPQFDSYQTLVDDGIIAAMIQNITDLRAGVTPATSWLWDPGRDPSRFDATNFVFPLPEDFSYSNAELLTAGTDGLPLGDLNWFPEAKTNFLANRAAYVAEIEGLTSAPDVDVVASVEAESGTVSGTAEVQDVDGQTFYALNPGSSIEWTFDVPTTQQYGLTFHVNMAGRGMSGLDVLVNGNRIFDARGWDQFVIPADGYGGPLDEWVELTYTVDDLADRTASGYVAPGEALTLEEGENTLRIQSSWAENTQWTQVDVFDPATGEVVATLTAPQAVSDRSTPACGEGVAYCANGFRYVTVTDGSVAWNVDVPTPGTYLARVFYSAPAGGTGTIELDGQPVVPVIAFETGSEDVLTSEFTVDAAGVKTFTLSANGGVNVDRMQLLRIDRGTVSTEGEILPDGYALEQNFPNPFNPSTTIAYELGASGPVRLAVYDVLGRKVATLVDEAQTAGPHEVSFDAEGLSSGLYLYRLETPVGAQVRTMMLVK